MKKFATLALVALFSITLIAGCGGGNYASDGTPEGDVKEVVGKMFEAAKDMDFDAIGALLIPEEAKKIEQVKAMMKMIPAEELDKQKAKIADAKMTFGAVKVTGDTATCETIVTGMGEEGEEKDTVNLKKVDGKWYLSSMPN